MPEPIKPCARPWAHLEHETTEGTCPGLANRIRRPSATPCPHPGCGHDAATPDAAHGLPLPLVNVLQELAQHYPPHEVGDAVALLWPDIAPAEAPVMGWRGGACRLRDRHDDIWNLHADGWWKSPTQTGQYGVASDLDNDRGPLTVVSRDDAPPTAPVTRTLSMQLTRCGVSEHHAEHAHRDSLTAAWQWCDGEPDPLARVTEWRDREGALWTRGPDQLWWAGQGGDPLDSADLLRLWGPSRG